MFAEKAVAIGQKIPGLIDKLTTEEATKNALIMPFIAALGYDVFNPSEVVPEFTADVGLKRAEKVDYAVLRDDEIIMLFECKKASMNLGDAEMSQLFRYFAVTKARIAVLTNGIQYWFYSDLEEPNKMDARPFLELDLLNIRPGILEEVKKLAKDEFDLDRMLGAANLLKFTSFFKKTLLAQLDDPEDEFVRFFYSRAVPGSRFTSAAKEQYSPLVKKAFSELVSERISSRLKSALDSETTGVESEKPQPGEEDDAPSDGITTTEEEHEGFRIVRAIACRVVGPERVFPRDTKSYFGVLLDDNNRKPICRLHFNGKQKYLGLFDNQKNENRIPIQNLAEIYKHADQLVSTIESYNS
jgi:hypothetical protein